MKQKEAFRKIIRLFEKDFWAKLDKEEQMEFNHLLEKEAWRHLKEDMNNGTLWHEGNVDKETFCVKKAFRKFENRVMPKKLLLRGYLEATVAIIVLLFAIGISYWFVNQETVIPKAELELVKQESFKQKVFLQFQNGDSILLSEMPVILSQTDGSKIEYDGKKVTYTADGKLADRIDTSKLVVPNGGECYLILEDGTKVWINAGSSIRYPSRFGEGERRVFVDGEVFLDVANDACRHFVVETRYGNVVVFGTKFGVRAYAGDCMRTTLVSGKVEYQGSRKIMLTPGEQVVVSPSGDVEKQKVNVIEFVGWKDGVYVFEKRPLEEIMKDFSRWYDIEIVFLSDEVKKLRFTGDIKRYDNILSFLKLLEKTEDVHYRIVGKKVELY